jgi:hypothetical protein
MKYAPGKSFIPRLSYWPSMVTVFLIILTIFSSPPTNLARNHASWVVFTMLPIGVGLNVEVARQSQWTRYVVLSSLVQSLVLLIVWWGCLLVLMNDAI